MYPIIQDSKVVRITKPKFFYFDFPEDVDKNIKNDIDCIVKHHEFLALHIIENEIRQLLSK